MLYTLSVKPNDELTLWFLFLDGRPIVDWNRDLETGVRLETGKHRLTYQLHGEGGELEFSLEPTAQITTPIGASFPYTAKIPQNRTADQDAIYFEI